MRFHPTLPFLQKACPSTLIFIFAFALLQPGESSLNAEEPEAEAEIKSTPAPTPEQIQFFDEKVYPILKTNCFRCHGTGEKLKAEFRLTSHEGLVRGGDLGAAWDPENPAKSLLLTAISYQDEQLKMPPKAALSADDQKTLSEWITAGAVYNPEKEIHGSPEELKSRGMVVTDNSRTWWAYKPLSKADPPQVADPEWNSHPVDAFLRAGMAEKSLAPNPPAHRRTLIRRAYFDLIGLPPTPEEVETFASDSRPEAFELLLDDLLSRPQYGEKWGRHWLDLVRYAETNGFERDGDKPEIWHYRDYVIRAFNQDKPYDQFIREQLAGDELDKVTPDSLIATGYYRLPQWDDEPADRLQHKYDVLDDIVRVTGETFLGSTIGCARCHDHKGDPIPQADYYRFMAFFHNVTEYNKGGTLKGVADPANPTGDPAGKEKLITDLKQKITAFEAQAAAKLKAEDIIVGAGESAAPSANPILPHSKGDSAHEWKYTTEEPAAEWMEIAFDDAKWKSGPAGFGNANPPNSRTRTQWESRAIWLRTDFRLTEIPEAAFLELYHDEDIEVWINGVRVTHQTGFITDYARFPLNDQALAALQTGKNVIAVVCRQTGGGQYVDVGLYQGALGKPLPELLGTLSKIAPDLRPRINQYKADLAKLADVENSGGGINAHIVTEPGKDVPQLHVHLRGSAHAAGDPVEPAFPQALSPEGTSAAIIPDEYKANNTSGRRRVLADWIASPENPITARVIANRLWQHHFGRGICPTTSDFGTLGEKPSHPELLDWLASEFIRQGWSFKKMHKRLMLSRAYQMSSAPNPDNLAKDPENSQFWRYDMRRLTAEEIRDTILAVSGDLNPKMGGAPVYPPLPPEVLATSSQPGNVWKKSEPDDEVRRSIYIKVKRSLRFPLLVDHDIADTDNTCVVRFVTTVPTQALGMLNSRLLNDQAAAFAARSKAEAGDDLAAQLKWAFENALSRPVTPEEITECKSLYQKLQTEFALTPDEALNRICLVILNLNEFIYLD